MGQPRKTECGHKLKLSVECDSYYCEICDKWTEPVCSDKDCEFCRDRPERPSLVKKIPPAQ